MSKTGEVMIKIEKKEQCCGCSACKQICPKQCITMCADEEGFLYPVVEKNKCVNCGMCEKVCPVLNVSKKRSGEPLCYAAYNNNEEERLNSSSGGIFCLLARRIIEEGGIVFGAAMSDDCKIVHHIAVSELEYIEKLQGSKYVQSEIGSTYKQAREALEDGVKVLFSGTPCEIEGLKAYLQKDYEKLVCVDVVCHGSPSPKLWGNYVRFRERHAGATACRTFFRHKKHGWKKYEVLFKFTNNTSYEQILYKDLFMQMFLQNLCLRPSCYACSFKKENRESDMTLADFWGCGNICPDLDDDKGLSMILIHSEKGKGIFDSIKANMCFREVPIQAALKGNIAVTESCKKPPNREQFITAIDAMEFDILGKRYLKKASFKERLRRAMPEKFKMKIRNWL